ncbi:hypothetical protein I3760_01G078700 [Carya illinoinensis]|nr:hypothetical protein I3760_01G078700 [Carya illinoinensis]
MDPIIYRAAAQGNLEAFSDPLELDGFLTVNKNTIIHICISSILVEEDSCAIGGTDPASAAKFVKDVLDRCPSLLLKANLEDDTLLHVAARYGHASIVKVLFEHQKSQHHDLECGRVVEAIKEMIGKLNKERDTALHEAVRHNRIEVVKQLLMEVDLEFSFGANVAGETPLYLAAERCFPDLVSEILNKLKSPAYDGPLRRTALHAAAFWKHDEGMTKNILERYGRDLCKQADQNRWTPLHMAAYLNNIEPTKLLLKCDREVAYMKDAEGRTFLHIAAHSNKYGSTEAIISMCPDCCEVVDNEGRNALHLAIDISWSDAALIIQHNSSLRNLLNQKDNYGNTPLHHYCAKSVGYAERVLNSPRVDKMVFNKKNQTAYQTLESITMPGGFIGGDDHRHPGSAVLRKSAAFQVFIIKNALSLMLSSSAVFIHLFISLIPSEDFFEKRTSFLQIAFWFLLSSMTPMVLAFVTGTYVVLAHSNIAIPTCIICLSFVPILVYIFLKIKWYAL